MKIQEVTLKNYRSIEELTIDLRSEADSFCKILAGINEAGKSNILKGLALLSNDTTVTYAKDINKKAKRDKEKIEARYILDDSSHQIFLDYLSAKSVPKEIIDKMIINKIERMVTIDDASKRQDSFFLYLEKVPPITEYEYVVSTKTISKFVDGTVADADHIRWTEQVDFEGIFEMYYLSEALTPHMPSVVFWQYEDSYLITQPIDLATFAADPLATSRPLRNVFNLAGYPNAQIPAVINEALADGSQMGEMEDALSTAITDYLGKVWPEHKVEIKVKTSSTTIEFHVKEQTDHASARFEIHERSDGFKHFFAILLNLAVENTTDQLKDSLIILDEPEVHLHPSGAKFLRDELLRIAKNNTLVYSTHSIFMIDKTCLSRHYKVHKDGEKTKLIKIDDSNPFKEELIYEAMGTSVLDLISEHNILFEGLTDKKLFDAFTYKFRTVIKPLQLNTITVDSEQHFEQYCQFFNKKNIKGYIVADSDSEGVAAKRRIVDIKPGYNQSNTFVINDIVPTGKESCLEDLLPQDVLQKCIVDFSGVPIILDMSVPFKKQMSEYNKKTGSAKIDIQKLKLFICNYICEDIAKNSMTKELTAKKYELYHSFALSLNQKIKESGNS